MDTPQSIAESIVADSRVIAVVGASPNPARPSYMVASYLIDNGFVVIPVRPKVKTILGCECYGSLAEIRVKVDIVDVFRKPEACPDIARAAVEAGAGALWLQEGIISEDAAGIARDGGLRVVMDLCIKKVHAELLKTGF
ncbi:MAG: CoA-binding protein [Thermoleophilia bacterium]